MSLINNSYLFSVFLRDICELFLGFLPGFLTGFLQEYFMESLLEYLHGFLPEVFRYASRVSHLIFSSEISQSGLRDSFSTVSLGIFAAFFF